MANIAEQLKAQAIKMGALKASPERLSAIARTLNEARHLPGFYAAAGGEYFTRHTLAAFVGGECGNAAPKWLK